MKDQTNTPKQIINGFYLVYFAVGLIWIQSVYGKIAGGMFVNSLKMILTSFAENNPYPWVKYFLQNIAIPNSYLFAILTMVGEAFTAFSLVVATLVIIKTSNRSKSAKILLTGGLATGALLNTIFFFSAGWTGPATWSLNALMAVVQIIGIFTLVQDLKKSA